MSFITDQNMKEFCEHNNDQAPINFYKEFPLSWKGLIKVLEQMLEFNPHFRTNPKELLQNKFFDGCRHEFPNYEIEAEWKIKLEIDKKEAYDYLTNTPGEVRSIKNLKNTLLLEIEMINRANLFEVKK